MLSRASEIVRLFVCERFHTKHHEQVRAKQEWYLRCTLCWFRSPGIPVGARNYARTLPGDPEMFKLKTKPRLALVTRAALEEVA